MDTKVQKIKITFAKYRTNGFILDFLVKSLNIVQGEKLQKPYQRFIKEREISSQEYHDLLDTIVSDILDVFFDNIRSEEAVYCELLIKEFLSYYQQLKTNNETLACSQRQLDFIELIHTFIPLVESLLPTKKLQTIINLIVPDKKVNAIQKLFKIIEKSFNSNDIIIKDILSEALNKNKNLGYDSINKDVYNWINGKSIPDSKHVDIFVKGLYKYSTEFTKNELKTYFKLAKVMQYLYEKSIGYFEDELTIRLIEHFRFLSALKSLYYNNSNDNREFEKSLKKYYPTMSQHLIQWYLDIYFYHNTHLSSYLVSRVKENDRYIPNEKDEIKKFIREAHEHQKNLYLINEDDFFKRIDSTLPIRYLNGRIQYEDLQNIDITIINKEFQKYSELLAPLNTFTYPNNKKTEDSEANFLVQIKNFEESYDIFENPYYHFIKARHFAQKREYKKSTEHYLVTLKFGKNCMGSNIKDVIKEGLIVSAQDTRKEQLDLINAKSAFTTFYMESYLYKLIDDLPNEINQYFLNDIKKQFDSYFTNLYTGTKEANFTDILRNKGIVYKDNNVKIDFTSPDKEIKKVYSNKVSQLMHCSFKADYAGVRKLVQNGADVNYIRNIDNYTALIATLENKIKKENIKIAKLLIPKMSKDALNAKLIKKQETVLSYAINRGLVDIVELLINNGIDINQKISLDEQTPLYYCITIINIVKNGVDKVLDLSDKKFIKENPFELKTEMKKILRTSNMINAVFDSDKEDWFNLKNNDKNFQQIKNALLTDKTLILELYYTENLDNLYKIFDLILNATTDVNIPVKEGLTPLILATQLNEEILVDKLLKNGADKDVRTTSNHKAIHYAIQNENRSLFEKLV
ncbi:protein containing ankyrin repeat [Sulfurimonas gotlandica GD1]|uniref:Protein containing ankyrin repeat n=1 Tax=Sulfurimonas gotlandica (strain DSM 19862 / JCM 16533 / GD1) TaxID=929558 RepID=B6BKZ7_SULGG|nr:ankyrin repeat protein [Sulfurimonas gotlandica GD1]EHP28729.1 protein containing ankyrin repeat [Sulfurimonas gotlandica GD1]